MTDKNKVHEKKDDVIEISLGRIGIIRKNPWILVSVVLAIVLVIVIFYKSSGVSGDVVSKEVAGQN